MYVLCIATTQKIERHNFGLGFYFKFYMKYFFGFATLW